MMTMTPLSVIFSGMRALSGGVGMRHPSLRFLAGEHRSRFLGRGLGFFRKVVYDPAKHSIDQIDWLDTRDPSQVFARETLLLRDNKVILVLDLSSSISFGIKEPVKEKLMLESAGTVGLTAAHNHDQVGLIGFADQIIINEPARGGERRVYYLIRRVYDFLACEDEHARRGTNFPLVLNWLSRTSYRGTIFIFSDFVGCETIAASPIFKNVAIKHDLVCVIVDDPEEYNVRGLMGTVTLQDRESGALIKIPIRRFRKIKEEISRRRQAMQDEFKRLGVDSIVLTYGNHVGSLAALFKERRSER
jgi:uncharacterized protein (DUF58 family)